MNEILNEIVYFLQPSSVFDKTMTC